MFRSITCFPGGIHMRLNFPHSRSIKLHLILSYPSQSGKAKCFENLSDIKQIRNIEIHKSLNGNNYKYFQDSDPCTS